MVNNLNNLQYFYTVVQTLVFVDTLHRGKDGIRWFRGRIRYRAPPRKTQGADTDRKRRSIRAVHRVQSAGIDTNNGLENDSSTLPHEQRHHETDRKQRHRRIDCIYSCADNRCRRYKRV